MDTINEFTAPEFLTKEFFIKVLENGLPTSQVEIVRMDITMGSGTGDNYCSEIYRANIIYKCVRNNQENKTISLIVKAMPYSESRGPVLEDLQVYEKEVEMYMKTLPKMSAILNNEFFCAK